MCLLLESIKVKNRKLHNISYHNDRFNRSRQELFGTSDTLYLEEIIQIPSTLSKGVFKCRVIYSKQIKKIEFLPYSFTGFQNLKIIFDDNIDYNYKYSNRACFDKHMKNHPGFDGILIVKNGLITDTSFSNIVFYDGKRWITPSTPLLKGTKRARLLKEKIIFEEKITIKNLQLFEEARLINAMIDLEDCVKVSISGIKI